MAGQGLFLRASNSALNSCLLIRNRFLQVNSQPQVSGLKHSFVEKLKELKIPEKPKRPLSAYFRFVQEHRSAILKQHPNLKVTEVSKKCAEDWKSVHPTVKEKYEREYKNELENYSKKISQYTASLSEEQQNFLKELENEHKKDKQRRELKKQIRETHKPKRPIGAYMMFVMEQAKGSNKSYPTLLTELKEKWANLSINEKTKYNLAADHAKKQYDKELEAWEQKMIQEGHENLVRIKTLAEKRPATLRKMRKDKDE